MAILTKYKNKTGKPGKRFVRKHAAGDFYVWCIQDAENKIFDYAQGTCTAEDLPPDVKNECDKRKHGYFYACEWSI